MKLWIMAAALAATPVAAQAQARELPRPIGITRAVAIAEQATGGKVTDAELDSDRGKLIYEIELVKGRTLYEVQIDARSGQVRRATPRIAGYWAHWFQSDELRHAARARPLSRILADLENRTGGQVLEASFDVEAGRPLYEVKISTRAGVADIYVDPGTGKRLALVHDD